MAGPAAGRLGRWSALVVNGIAGTIKAGSVARIGAAWPGARAAVLGAAVGAGLLWGGATAAGRDDDPRLLAERLMAPLPADVDAVVVVTGAAGQRNSGPGRALAAMVMEVGPLSETAKVWNEQLASPLGWTPEQAFDELLGQRVMFIVRGLGAEGEAWAVLSEVTPQAEERLRASLRPAPRRVDGGAVVLALEGGKYELGVARRARTGPVMLAAGAGENGGRAGSRVAGGAGPAEGAERSLILLARARDARLFDELVPRLSDRIGQREGREPDVMVAMRGAGAARLIGGAAGAEGPDAAGALFVLKANRDDGGWRAECVSSPGLPFGPVGEPADVRPWSDTAFQGLKNGAMVAVMGNMGSIKAPALPKLLDLPVLNLLGAGGNLPLGPRGAMVVSEPGAGGTVTVSVAIETPDVKKLSAKGDPIVAAIVPLLQGQEAGEAAHLAGQFDGAPPDGIRLIGLGGELTKNAAPVFGKNPALVWTYPEARGVNGQPLGGGRGWWVLSVAPGDAALPSELYSALAAPDGERWGRWLSMGMVKPARLAAWVAGIDDGLGVAMKPLKWVDSLEWDALVRPDGLISCRVNVRMAVPPGAK